MNKIKLILTGISLLISLSAFTQKSKVSYEYTVNLIDSILKKEGSLSKEHPAANYYDIFFDPYMEVIEDTFYYDEQNKPHIEFSKIMHKSKNINPEYEQEVLTYLEKFMYDSLQNIRRIVNEMIYSLGQKSENLKVRQGAVNDLLIMYFFPDCHKERIKRFRIKDFDKRAKERIKELLLAENKTQTEIDFYITDYMKCTEAIWNKNKFDSFAYISKRDKLPYEYVRDSIYRKTKTVETERFIVRVPGYELIALAGRLYMYDFVDELEAMLEGQRYREPEKQGWIKLALARMGNKKYEAAFI